MKQAMLYRRGDELFVHASSETTDGVWILSEPCLKLGITASNADIGRVLKEALQGSRTKVPHPKVWTNLFEPILKYAGVRSWSSFRRGATSSIITEADSAITVIPTTSGQDDSFQPRKSHAVTLFGPSDDELGRVARQVLDLSAEQS